MTTHRFKGQKEYWQIIKIVVVILAIMIFFSQVHAWTYIMITWLHLFDNRLISIYLNSVLNNRPQSEALGNKPHKLCIYSPEPRTEVYCLKLNFNILKLVYLTGPTKSSNISKGFRGALQREDPRGGEITREIYSLQKSKQTWRREVYLGKPCFRNV